MEGKNLERTATWKRIDTMKAYLDHPNRDPGSDPIPAFVQRLRAYDRIMSLSSRSMAASSQGREKTRMP